ncbi:MAG: NAD(P)-dependent oxidoreductase [Bacteroidales bacterium]
MKQVLLIGGSGFVGSAILKELLDRGYQVTTMVRNPDQVTIKSDALTVVKGDVSDTAEIEKLAKGKDAVISAYNPGWKNPQIYEETLKNYPQILKAVKAAGVKRFLIVGGAGTLFVAPGVRVVDTGVIPEAIMGGVKSLGEFYLNTLIPEKDIDWVFFSPAGSLEPGDKTGNYRLGKDDLIVDAAGQSRISVGDYAKAMVDELEKQDHHKERFTIGY